MKNTWQMAPKNNISLVKFGENVSVLAEITFSSLEMNECLKIAVMFSFEFSLLVDPLCLPANILIFPSVICVHSLL